MQSVLDLEFKLSLLMSYELFCLLPLFTHSCEPNPIHELDTFDFCQSVLEFKYLEKSFLSFHRTRISLQLKRSLQHCIRQDLGYMFKIQISTLLYLCGCSFN